MAEEGSAPGFYNEAKKHVGRFSWTQFQKCRAFRRAKGVDKSPTPGELVDTSDVKDLEDPLPLVSVDNVKGCLKGCLKAEEREGFLSPLPTGLKIINQFIKK